MKKFPVATALVVSLGAISAAAYADLAKHKHLQAAHKKIEAALKDLGEAKNGKDGDFGGHRDKAEELLKQASGEIDQAADFADKNPDKK